MEGRNSFKKQAWPTWGNVVGQIEWKLSGESWDPANPFFFDISDGEAALFSEDMVDEFSLNVLEK